MPGHLRRVFAVTSGVSRDRARVRARLRRLWVLESLEARLLLSGSPTIYTVNSTGNGTTGTGDSGTLPYVISQANGNANTTGSEIRFDPTVFASPQTITMSSTLVLSETAGPEAIDGPGANIVTVSGGNAVGVFSVTSGVTASLTSLTITGGKTDSNGGGIENDGTMTITNCSITGNTACSRFVDIAGGGIDNRGTLTLADSTIANNFTGGNGGGIDNRGTLTVTDSTIANNSNRSGGSGIENDGTMTVTDSTVANNSSSGGGGIDNLGTLTITDSTIDDNSAGYESSGRGIYNGGTMTIIDSTIDNNGAFFHGGGIYNGGTTGEDMHRSPRSVPQPSSS